MVNEIGKKTFKVNAISLNFLNAVFMSLPIIVTYYLLDDV